MIEILKTKSNIPARTVANVSIHLKPSNSNQQSSPDGIRTRTHEVAEFKSAASTIPPRGHV